MLAGQTQVASAETLYYNVSKLAAAVDALEKKAGGVGGVSTADLKCAHLEMLSIVLVVDSGSPGCVAASQHASRPVRTRRRRALRRGAPGVRSLRHTQDADTCSCLACCPVCFAERWWTSRPRTSLRTRWPWRKWAILDSWQLLLCVSVHGYRMLPGCSATLRRAALTLCIPLPYRSYKILTWHPCIPCPGRQVRQVPGRQAGEAGRTNQRCG